MARVFITGSADGLGKMAAQLLVEEGHKVVLHARNDARGKEAMAGVRGAEAVVTGDFFKYPPDARCCRSGERSRSI
jgi:NAD(P)-dependent dehydrogenase (short-subunit alcohol dehydrogenase family)